MLYVTNVRCCSEYFYFSNLPVVTSCNQFSNFCFATEQGRVFPSEKLESRRNVHPVCAVSSHGNVCFITTTLTHSALNTPFDVLLNSPEMSCKEYGRICFILDKLLCMIICFILIIRQLILCRYCKENLRTHKLTGDQRVNNLVEGLYCGILRPISRRYGPTAIYSAGQSNY